MRQVKQRSQGMLDKTTISRIENGDRRLSLRAAYAFSRIYSISLEQLIERELEMQLPPGEPPFVVSLEEQALIMKYRHLARARRRMAQDVLHGLTLLPDNGDPAY